MKKTSGRVLPGILILVASLTGCEGGTRTAASGGDSTTFAAAPAPVVVTWQPRNKPEEFLSGWRPKERASGR
ncbi:hypothetical protein AB4Z46_11665 [Variovorax sp. M-6]|uniref:hypothetical protein n=1 Tax=Variovorax sp. M-6 TaxID=3233041 RepID=UPI003F99D369